MQTYYRGFPGGPVVKNLPASAIDMGLIPDQEDSTCCEATKSTWRDDWDVLQSLGFATSEATSRSSPYTATRAYPPLFAIRETLATVKIQHTQDK